MKVLFFVLSLLVVLWSFVEAIPAPGGSCCGGGDIGSGTGGLLGLGLNVPILSQETTSCCGGGGGGCGCKNSGGGGCER